MEDAIDAVECALQNVGLQDVAADIIDLHSGITQRCGKVLFAPSDEVVVDDDFLDFGTRQLLDRVGADEAGTADDDNFLAAKFHI